MSPEVAPAHYAPAGSAWRRKRNRFWQRADGTYVMQSRLPLWQAAVGTLGVLLYGGLQLTQFYFPALPVALASGAGAVVGVYAGLFSRCEIGPTGLVLRRYGWCWPAVRVPLSEVVLAEQAWLTAEPMARQVASQRLHLEWGLPYESDDKQLYLTFREQSLGHVFDDDFAWSCLQQVVAKQRTSRA